MKKLTQPSWEIARDTVHYLGVSAQLDEIPGVVRGAVTFVDHVPGQPNLSAVYLDVSMGDKEGKLSLDSLNYVSSFAIHLPSLAGKKSFEVVAFIKCSVDEALRKLKDCIAKGKNVPVGVPVEVGE